MPKKYPTDQRDRALRMALERLDYPSPWAAAQALGPKLGVGPETLRKWIVQAQVDGGARPGPSSEELTEIKALKSQVRDLTEANEMAISSRVRNRSVESDVSPVPSAWNTIVPPKVTSGSDTTSPNRL